MLTVHAPLCAWTARSDAAAGLIRPSVHLLKTDMHMAWGLEDDGTPFTGSRQVRAPA